MLQAILMHMVADPDWTRDELILACDLMAGNDWRQIRETDPRAAGLSELLRSLPIHPVGNRSDKFRGPGSVSRKTADIAAVHPGYVGAKTRGSRLDREVLNNFLESPDEMRATAKAIRQAAAAGELGEKSSKTGWDVAFPEDIEVREGRLLAARYFRRERDPRLRKKKIESFLESEDQVHCEVCAFDFEATYGERGNGYIEVHHMIPLHVSGETKTKLADLILLCANCHRMIHSGSQWLHPDELRELLAAHGGAGAL
ncbi:5-methylcytosine-specific restriction protein A [Nocardia tenerifensis]|uniref:5-methylcytosine-specific restriction protein A n=2 Tax=Nocardia tenerifensis TaxID=228006 RepID=A0A318K4Z0_9NOCA|nr:5-methylcytosine-specific restriction protein A [Nocardia tenerifensis]